MKKTRQRRTSKRFKLTLNTETVRILQDGELADVAAAAVPPWSKIEGAC